jgi:hypothetical protein
MRPVNYFIVTCLAVFISCAPQSETRVHMDIAGNRMSDSIQRCVDSSLAAPGEELAGTGSSIASGAASFTSVELPK